MTFDRKEEFFGIGSASAHIRRWVWFGLLFEFGFGLVFITMWWWQEGNGFSGDVHAVYIVGFLISPLIGLYFLYRFIRDAIVYLRAPVERDVEVLWYVIDARGLHIMFDPRNFDGFARTEIISGETGPCFVLEWSAMKSLVAILGASPRVKIVRRPPGALIDRTLTLTGGQRSRDGASFEDRISVWYGARTANATGRDRK